MQKIKKQPLSRSLTLITLIIFLASYLLSLVLWIQVKDGYGYGVIYAASHLVTIIKEVKFEEVSRQGKDTIQATFRPLRQNANMLMDIPMKTSSYTFNSPLTFAIMAALFPFIKRRRRAYIEALAVLFAIHLLTIFSYEAAKLTMAFAEKGFDPVNKTRIAAYQFLWQFTEHMVIKFEPFLIGFYLYVRFRN